MPAACLALCWDFTLSGGVAAIIHVAELQDSRLRSRLTGEDLCCASYSVFLYHSSLYRYHG